MRAHRNSSAGPPGPEKSPRVADEQDAPEPERPTTPLEDAEQDIASMDDPPQAEGQRDDEDD